MRSRLQTHTTTDRLRPVLVWRAPTPVIVISSGAFGGGMALRSWIANVEVPSAYDRVDIAEHAGEVKAELGLDGDGVVLLTAASVERHTVAEDGGVVATGRDAPQPLIDVADTVTEMRMVKHAYQRGITAKKGIEY